MVNKIRERLFEKARIRIEKRLPEMIKSLSETDLSTLTVLQKENLFLVLNDAKKKGYLK
ncbi:hypothetical protein [Phytobacter sp. V91]|uniref:hypothetical protein n=1 Tax=Phytobacter sp. V91 TaxID=3369425 RepID=UPI003F5FEF58